MTILAWNLQVGSSLHTSIKIFSYPPGRLHRASSIKPLSFYYLLPSMGREELAKHLFEIIRAPGYIYASYDRVDSVWQVEQGPRSVSSNDAGSHRKWSYSNTLTVHLRARVFLVWRTLARLLPATLFSFSIDKNVETISLLPFSYAIRAPIEIPNLIQIRIHCITPSCLIMFSRGVRQQHSTPLFYFFFSLGLLTTSKIVWGQCWAPRVCWHSCVSLDCEMSIPHGRGCWAGSTVQAQISQRRCLNSEAAFCPLLC